MNPPPAPIISRRPPWPKAAGRPVVFLLDASSGYEQHLLEDWLEKDRPEDVAPSEVEAVPIPPSRRRRRLKGRIDPRLAAVAADPGDPLLVPLRVVWRVGEREGMHAVQLIDLFKLGDPRDPDALRQRWLRLRYPDRCWIVAGEPATVSQLRREWAGGDGSTSLPEHIVRRAHLALERSERQVRGARYKVPRFIHEQILDRPVFQAGMAALARTTNRSIDGVSRQANRYLREIAATHSPYVIDLVAHLIRLLYRQGYRGIDYDRNELERIYALTQRYPLVFLPSHKSNLDHLVLQYLLYENQHPPNHTAGGINMSFFPVGPLVRRTGVFFIRRSFKKNPVYKFVLRQYLAFLLEKRFSLEWYIEGGRSRSGKLREPRYGMLAYVVDAYREGASDDVVLVPVSIAYDQLQDVRDYVAEQMGKAKKSESFRELIEFVRRMRRPYGAIHVRFGEPLSVAERVGPPSPRPVDETVQENDKDSLEVQKLAFEVCVRINRVTPITPSSLVTLGLLGTGDRAVTVDELTDTLQDFVAYVRHRGLPTTAELELDKPDGVREALDALVENGVVSRFEEGPEQVYRIGPDTALMAAYYRNTIIHFFLTGAITELALLVAADAGDDHAAVFWNETQRLRDLLKFEFFFPERDLYVREIEEELAYHDPDWNKRFAEGSDGVRALLGAVRPYRAHWVLRPFLEAYRVVGDTLEQLEADAEVERKPFISKLLGIGKQYALQHRITSAESVSALIFEAGYKLADNRGLLDPAAPGLVQARRDFAGEVRDVIDRVDAIETLAAARRTGLM